MAKPRTRVRGRTFARRLARPEPDFRTVTLTRAATAKAMATALEAQHRLHFVVKWTPQRPLVLLSLQIRGAPGTVWDELLDHPLSDNDGEIVFDMGLYSAGQVTIRFSIGALTQIPKCATFLTEDEQNVTPFKPDAGKDPKALDQGERWQDKGTYDVASTP